MKQIIIVVFISLGLAACSGKAKTAANNISTNTVVQADTAQAQQIVANCMAKGNFMTHTGRAGIMSCIAPPGHGPAFQACVSNKAATFKYATKAERDADYQAIAVCLEQNR